MRSPSTKDDESHVTIGLSIACMDETTAAALDQALMPDNRYFPKDQDFLCSRDGRLVRFEIRSPRLRPALATARSIISDANLFGEVWIEVETRGLGTAASR